MGKIATLPSHLEMLQVQLHRIAKLLCEHVCFMCVLKPYLDSILSESDWIGIVVRFGLNYLTQKRFGQAASSPHGNTPD